MNRPMKLADLIPARRPAAAKANRVPRLPAAPVIAMHPMNLPMRTRKPKAAKANRVPRLPAAPVIAMHPMNLPFASVASKPKAAKANRVPRLPAAAVVKRHPMNRPKVNAFLINNAMRSPGLSVPVSRSPAFSTNLSNII